MKKLLYTFLFLIPGVSFGGTFTSHSSGDWTDGAAVWTIAGDADGIPDADDDVIISAGNTITWSSNRTCLNLTVNGTIEGPGNTTHIMRIRGNYTMNGSEAGQGYYFFLGGGTISGSGSFSSSTIWTFGASYTIDATVTATKTYYVRIYYGAIITNNGTLNFRSQVIAYATPSAFINNGTVTIGNPNFMVGYTFDADNIGNTVIININSSQSNRNIVTPSTDFYNLTISGNVESRLTADVTVQNNFTLSSGSIYNQQTSTLTVNGNWVANGGTMQNGTAVVLGGTTQSVTGTSTARISCPLEIGATSTTTLATPLLLLSDLTINGTLDVSASNFAINARGHWTNNGTFTARNGTVVFDGASLQDIGGTAYQEFNNLSVSTFSGVQTTASTGLRGALTLSNNGDFASNGNLILVSDATATARIATIPSGSQITGAVTVQRFISGRSAGYTDMASPVSNSTFDDWDDEITIIYNYAPPGGYPSAWAYSESDWDYVPITAATTAIEPGVGYEVYLDSYGTYTTFDPTTLTTRGVLNQGDIDISGDLTAVNDGWNLVGNPYASHLDWSAFQTASGGTIAGTYMYYDATISDFNSASSGTIAPTQGFWIEVLSTPANATFTESMKSTSTSSTFRNAESERFTLRLRSDLIPFTSNAQFEFDPSYSSEYESGIDLPFKRVPHPDAPELYTLVHNGKKLRINKTYQQENNQITLGFKVSVSGKYSITPFNKEALENSGYTCAYLVDSKTGIKHDLLAGDYTFYASSEDMEDRFILELSSDFACNRSSVATITERPDFMVRENTVQVKYPATEGNSFIRVINSLGQLIVEEKMFDASSGFADVNLPDVATGMMIVQLSVGDQIYSYKIIR